LVAGYVRRWWRRGHDAWRWHSRWRRRWWRWWRWWRGHDAWRRSKWNRRWRWRRRGRERHGQFARLTSAACSPLAQAGTIVHHAIVHPLGVSDIASIRWVADAGGTEGVGQLAGLGVACRVFEPALDDLAPEWSVRRPRVRTQGHVELIGREEHFTGWHRLKRAVCRAVGAAALACCGRLGQEAAQLRRTAHVLWQCHVRPISSELDHAPVVHLKYQPGSCTAARRG
jgi:hypothetical protein